MTTLDHSLEQIAAAESEEDLLARMGRVLDALGVGSFSYVDVRRLPALHEQLPYFATTVRRDFIDGYTGQGFLSYDPVLRRASVSNAPFAWLDCPEFEGGLKKRPGVKSKPRQILEYAADHGFIDGYIVPAHAVDQQGIQTSATLALYWDESLQRAETRPHPPNWLRLAALTFHERMLELRGLAHTGSSVIPVLTDRERDCMLWACRGKTRGETADILGISARTVEFHFKNAMRKLGVHNKFHAIAVAIHLGLIAP